jgi:uncharacterized membrane protein
MDELVLLLLRLVHIAGGVFWVGAAVIAFGFVEPAAHDLGEEGRKFMHQLTVRRRLPDFVTASAVLSLVSGGILYWRMSGGLQREWILSPPGLGFTMGATAAILAAVVAVAFLLPTLKRIGSLTPASLSPSAAAMLPMLELRLRRASQWNALLLIVSVAAMATARYWG